MGPSSLRGSRSVQFLTRTCVVVSVPLGCLVSPVFGVVEELSQPPPTPLRRTLDPFIIVLLSFEI